MHISTSHVILVYWHKMPRTPNIIFIEEYHILPNKHTCLNKCIPRLLTLPGHISQTTEPSTKCTGIHEFPLWFSLRSNKVRGSFSASAPGLFIRQNTVDTNTPWDSLSTSAINSKSKYMYSIICPKLNRCWPLSSHSIAQNPSTVPQIKSIVPLSFPLHCFRNVKTTEWLHLAGKCSLCRKYSRNLHKTSIIVFVLISAIKRVEFHLSSAISSRVSLFG